MLLGTSKYLFIKIKSLNSERQIIFSTIRSFASSNSKFHQGHTRIETYHLTSRRCFYSLAVASPQARGIPSSTDIRDCQSLLREQNLSTRSSLNERLVIAFDIDIVFAMHNEECRKQFVMKARSFLATIDNEGDSVTAIVRDACHTFLGSYPDQGQEIPLVALVRAVVFVPVAQKPLPERAHLNLGSSIVNAATTAINDLWLESKVSSSCYKT